MALTKKQQDAIVGMVILDIPTGTTDTSESSETRNGLPTLPQVDGERRSRESRPKRGSWWNRRVVLFLLVICVTSLVIALTSLLVSQVRDSPESAPPAAIAGPRTNPETAKEGSTNTMNPQYTLERDDGQCPIRSEPPPLPGKKGIGLALGNDGAANIKKVIALNPYWNYSWGPQRIEEQPDNIEFVPMIWGGKNAAKIPAKVNLIIPHIQSGKVKRLLGFNEPDKAQQSDMTVQQALNAWPSLEFTGLPLASPSCAQPTGGWMQEFMDASTERCSRIDWIGAHWYGGANFQNFKRAMRNIFEQHGSSRKVWITEFAPADYQAQTVKENRFSEEDVLDFMKDALPWLEAQDWVAGYAWFSFKQTKAVGTSSALFDMDDNLTALGRFYSTVTTQNPMGDQMISV